MTDDSAAEYIWKNGLYNHDSYSFLNKYLKRVERGKITETSAFTLNGFPELKDSVCKTTLNVANFIQSDDGIWFINEKSASVEKTDESGNKYTKWEMQYLTPYLLEDKNGNLVRQQPEALQNYKICPVIQNDYEADKGFSVYNGWLLMRDMDGQTFCAYKNGEFLSKPSYSQMISYLNKANKPVESETRFLATESVEREETLPASSSTNTWFIISIILFLLLAAAIILIIILHSKNTSNT